MTGSLLRAATAALLLAGLGGCAAPGPSAGVTPQRWQLVFFHPSRPGVLQQCEYAQLRPEFAHIATPDPADPLKAWNVDGPLALQWSGGRLQQAGGDKVPDTAARPHPITDLCFTLRVDGQVLATGAVVHEYSARLLRFPTLVRLRESAASGAPQYRLQPRFPAAEAEPGPAAWSVLGTL